MRTAEQQAQFEEERRTGIGGSDAPKVCGISPWGGPFDVYEEKRGLRDGNGDVTPAMEFGLKLEPLIIEDYVELTDQTINGQETFWRHPEHSWMIFHADRLVVNSNGYPIRLVEAKSVGAFVEHKWGDAGTDEIPESYIVQCQHGLAIVRELFGIDVCDVVVRFLGSRRREIYHVRYDPEFTKRLLDVEGDFWHNHVLKAVPPPVDASESASKFLRRQFPRDTGIEITASAEIDDVIQHMKQLAIDERKLTEDKNFCRNKVMEFMGDAAVLTGSVDRITYKLTKDGQTVDWQAVATELAPSTELIKTHTKVKTGVRRFVPPRHWGKEV